VLSVLTCLFYNFYWFYKNWRDLARHAASADETSNPGLRAFNSISPLLRTIGLLVPVLQIYLPLTLVKGIAELHPGESTFPRRHPLWASGLVIGFWIAFMFLGRLPGSLYLLSFLAAIPLAVSQSWLNDYWQAVESKDVVVRQAFTVKELMVIIAGSMLLALILTRFIIGR